MNTLTFGTSARDGRALDRLMGSVEPGDVESIRSHGGAVTVVLGAERAPPAPVRRFLAPVQ